MESRKNNTIGLVSASIVKRNGNVKLEVSAKGIEPFTIEYRIRRNGSLCPKTFNDAVSKFRIELNRHLLDICSSEYQYTLKKLRMNKFLDKYLEVAVTDLSVTSAMGVLL